MEIKTATACYTGGGIYIYWGQLENGLYFRTWDDAEAIYICGSDTEAEEADYPEFYETHLIQELTGDDFAAFWNGMLSHIIETGNPGNYSSSDLERRKTN